MSLLLTGEKSENFKIMQKNVQYYAIFCEVMRYDACYVILCESHNLPPPLPLD